MLCIGATPAESKKRCKRSVVALSLALTSSWRKSSVGSPRHAASAFRVPATQATISSALVWLKLEACTDRFGSGHAPDGRQACVHSKALLCARHQVKGARAAQDAAHEASYLSPRCQSSARRSCRQSSCESAPGALRCQPAGDRRTRIRLCPSAATEQLAVICCC